MLILDKATGQVSHSRRSSRRLASLDTELFCHFYAWMIMAYGVLDRNG